MERTYFNAFIAIGNGLHADGMPGNIGASIVNRIFDTAKAIHYDTVFGRCVIFSGGYRNRHGLTEAEAMYRYKQGRGKLVFGSWEHFFMERESYRTHNNAIHCMKLASTLVVDFGNIFIVDHPKHIKRTMLCFRVVNRLFYRRHNFHLVPMPCEEVYDPNIEGQPYWASAEEFCPREEKTMKVYRFLLFRPWERIGLFILRTAYPSSKQDFYLTVRTGNATVI